MRRPFRVVEFTETSSAALREELAALQVSARFGASKINIYVLGWTGSGKSAVIRTWDTNFYHRELVSTRTGEVIPTAGHATVAFGKYQIGVFQDPSLGFPSFPDHLCLALCDTVGWDESNYQDGTINYFLDGHFSHGFAMPVGTPLSPLAAGYKAQPVLDDIMHAAVFVMPLTKLVGGEASTQKAYLARAAAFLRPARARGMKPFVIITHCDELRVVADDLTKLYHSKELQDVINLVSRELTVDTAMIYPMVNFNEGMMSRDLGLEVASLVALRAIAYEGKRYLEERAASFAQQQQAKPAPSRPRAGQDPPAASRHAASADQGNEEDEQEDGMDGEFWDWLRQLKFMPPKIKGVPLRQFFVNLGLQIRSQLDLVKEADLVEDGLPKMTARSLLQSHQQEK